ncbi:hypothetical protein RDWZM_001067 [Blomia tropicalis]|uniref:Exocyst complex component Sec3 PIP2-binding N-terminal domain-containing protein n=1 Tax=Blomia tropicalis TaxID=40697 RepID=A0A9Q0MDJ8_BLOTA|nr:Exocyst complex component 1 [Blomia tropicalis]KAJ6222522.1 hypothetical protein RDWZM_001067 [Blomia tropicalis]
MATTLQQLISRDLFQQHTERIKYVIPVVKPSKRKKTHFLALVVNNLKNTYSLNLIKKNEQTDKYYKDRTWLFDEIQVVDAKHDDEDNEFEISFHGNQKQTFKWVTLQPNEKFSFLQTMCQIVNQVPLYSEIKFINLPSSNGFQTQQNINQQPMDDQSMTEKLSNNDDGEWNSTDESYQALTSREEADLERLLELEVENTINNAEAFTEKLSRDLSSMDSCNIQDIMASEQRVIDLMNVLQNAVEETFRLENKIIFYESQLKNVRDIVQKVEKKEAIVQIYNDNNNRLLDEVGQLVSKLDFTKDLEFILAECDLHSHRDQTKALEAAMKLQDSLQHEIPTALQSMKAVTEQRNYLKSIASMFSYRLKDHLYHLIGKLGEDCLERSMMMTTDGQLYEHTIVYQRLMPYSSFMKWLRECGPEQYTALIGSYSNQFGTIYEKEFAQFFDYHRSHYVHTTKGNSSTLMASSTSPTDVKRKSLAVNDLRNSDLRRNSYADTSDTASLRSSEISLTEWTEFDQFIEHMLKTIDPVCMGEQRFCNQFFDLEPNANISIPSTPVLNKRGSTITNDETDTSISNHSSTYSETTNAKKNSDHELWNILSELFHSFESDFNSFVLHYDKLDGIYSLYFLVRLTNHVIPAQDTGSFLTKAYGNILIHIKRNFDRYMQSQALEIEEAKDPKRTKIGILFFIKRFESFAKQTENVIKYGNQPRRPDIDRWYNRLMEKIFQSISRIAKEHQRVYKTPSQMIELENYHYLQLMLPSLKIPCLEQERREAKARYNNALNEYVNLYFRRPLEKLNIFFEGVQQKVQQGVREEEIGYQLAFSKQELRKVIKDCNLKDIKKGLEEMYKRVEKHVSDPENNLIQVIWRSMQEEFITQYKSIEEMIERCYPQSNIKLSFSIADVLNVFSEIAQTH